MFRFIAVLRVRLAVLIGGKPLEVTARRFRTEGEFYAFLEGYRAGNVQSSN